MEPPKAQYPDNEEFIKFWWADFVFEIPPFFRWFASFKCLMFLVTWDHSVRILILWWLHFLLWDIVNFSYDTFHNCLEFVNIWLIFLILFPVVVNCSLYDEKLIMNLVFCLVMSTYNIESQVMKDRFAEIVWWL